jgi:hypothetical protein
LLYFGNKLQPLPCGRFGHSHNCCCSFLNKGRLMREAKNNKVVQKYYLTFGAL